ncbi:MAG: hypothetical protein ABS95_02930 [Verrucomicrobia bacterium SCN 57-15]|nr:MAG: hypothetical protein ABS95_02930 [Verrucomicrobia bacterium SCN 57-15]
MHKDQAHCTKARPASAGRAAVSDHAPPQPIRIEFHDEQAQSVSIIGTFNNWKTEGTRMLRVQPGRWLRVLFLPPGRYEYVFVVDGRCVADPNASENVPNVYGCMNSVLSVPFAPARNGCRQPQKPRRALVNKGRRRCRSASLSRLRCKPELQTIS